MPAKAAGKLIIYYHYDKILIKSKNYDILMTNNEQQIYMKKISLLAGMTLALMLGGCALPWNNQTPTSAQLNANQTATTPPQAQLVNLTSPEPNAIISSPVTISGEAKGSWYFEGTFPVSIVDSDNNELASGAATAIGEWTTDKFVPFTATLIFKPTTKTNGFIILKKDNPSGLPQNDASVRVPIRFADASQTSVTVYFGNSQQDPNANDCSKVYGTTRVVDKTPSIGQAALMELLAGPTEAEKQLGFFTSINPNVTIQELSISNGVASVDFNSALDYQVGGSCRVTAIRAQITKTLKQFPTVKSVIISINGNTDQILQP